MIYCNINKYLLGNVFSWLLVVINDDALIFTILKSYQASVMKRSIPSINYEEKPTICYLFVVGLSAIDCDSKMFTRL